MAKKKCVVVTGATGFVGRHVVAELLGAGYEVRCVVRKNSNIAILQALDGDINFVIADITQAETLAPAFEGAWGLINLAGYREFWSRSRKTFYKVNEQGAANVFRACLASGVARVIQVSTPLAYGVPAQIPFNEDTPAGEHPSDYARSKYKGDLVGLHLQRTEGLPLTIVYLAAVIGAGDDKETMEVKRALDKKMPALIGADTTYTYVYVRDAAQAIVRALGKDAAVGKRYLIGKERATTREYFQKIGDIANVPVPRINLPERALMPAARAMDKVSRLTGIRPLLPLDVLKTTAAGSLLFDGSRAESELDMTYTALDVALAEAIEALRTA